MASGPGIQLPGESRGILHDVSKWTKVSIAQIPMGQGVAVTPLQMAMAMCAIANKGVLMRPMLVSALQEQDGTVVAKYAPQAVRRVISEEADRDIIEALEDGGHGRHRKERGDDELHRGGKNRNRAKK